MTLEGRHLLVVFFVVVGLCAVFFALGFFLGRNQAAALRTATPPAQPAPAAQPGPQPRDLTFYDRVGDAKPKESLPAARPETKPAAPAASTPSSAPSTTPIYLQVAAVSQEADARRLASELRKLGFDCEIRPPKEERLYRVMVGPLATEELADTAKRRLEAQGYKSIVRR